MSYIRGVGGVNNDPYFEGAPDPTKINDPILDGYINDIYAFFANTWGSTEGLNSSLFNNVFGLGQGSDQGTYGPGGQMAFFFLKNLISSSGDEFQSRLSSEIALHNNQGSLDSVGQELQSMYDAIYTTKIYLQPPLPADPTASPPKPAASFMTFSDLCKEAWIGTNATDPYDARANAAWNAAMNAMNNSNGPLATFIFNACNFPARVTTYTPPYDTSEIEQVLSAMQIDLNHSNFTNVVSDLKTLEDLVGQLPQNDPSSVLLHTVLNSWFTSVTVPGTTPPLVFGTLSEMVDWLSSNPTNPQYQTVLKLFGSAITDTSVFSGLNPDGSSGSCAQLLESLLPFLQNQLMNWPKH